MEVNEDAGEIELLQISKHEGTELPVKIYITGSTCKIYIMFECVSLLVIAYS